MKKILLFIFIILWVWKPIPYEDVAHNKLVRQEVLVFRGGGQDSAEAKRNIGRKILLQNLFPDFPERVVSEKEKEKSYKLARAKLLEARKRLISDKLAEKLLTVQEKDALDYFNGTGFYKKYQNPKTLPNIFDTRQSFLLKMEYREVRENFLNNYNNRFKKDN